MFLKILYVCEKNEKYETIGDVFQILMLGLGIYYLISIKIIFQIVLLIIISVFLKEIINFITKKIFFKEEKTEENDKCKDCNSYEKWEK